MSIYNYLLLLVPVVGIAAVLFALRWVDSQEKNRLHPGE
jgi:hypothetical protein